MTTSPISRRDLATGSGRVTGSVGQGSFLDPQLENAETCSTAESTRGHCACVHAVVCGMKLADPGITTKLRRLTASQSRLIFPPPLLSQDAVRPWTCAWPPPLQRQLAEMLHRRHSIVSWRTTGTKSENSDDRTFITACVDCGRSRHSDASVRSRHRFQSGWAAYVGEVPSLQMEAPNPNRSPAEEGSHGSRCSPKPFCKGGVALRRHH